MKVSVAICTFNRAKLLDQTLGRMTELLIPEDVEWEILIVNNNCTDNTDVIIKKYEQRLPVRRIFEPILGISNARNRALKEARGDYIIWLDDDILVNSGWIVEYCKAFKQWPDVVVFGGPIEPLFEGDAPVSLKKCLALGKAAYGLINLGDKIIPLTSELVPYTSNCAVKTKEHLKHFFNTDLGNVGSKIRISEDVACIESILRDGAPGLWLPLATVQHYITKDRQSIRYLRQNTYLRNMSHMRFAYKKDKAAMLFGKPRWLCKAAIMTELRYRMKRIFYKKEVWIKDMILASSFWGKLRGYSAK